MPATAPDAAVHSGAMENAGLVNDGLNTDNDNIRASIPFESTSKDSNQKRLTFLASLSTCWDLGGQSEPDTDHQGCKGQLALASNSHQRRPQWHGTIT